MQGNHPIELLSGSCFPETAQLMYAKQAVAEDPVVGETFWVGVKVHFDESFACAADFWAAELTLPANLAPAISASAAPICIRTGVNNQGTVFTDQRAANNCPTAAGATGLTWTAGTRRLRIGPKPAATSPDFGDPTSRFFLGQANGESIEYKDMTVWVPVKATAAIAAQPMTALVCSNGMGCSSTFGGDTPVFTNVTVTSNAPPAVDLNINPDVWVSATGMNLQYFLTFSGGGTRSIRHHLWYDNGGGDTYVCGSPTASSYTDALLPSNGTNESHLFLFGSLDWSSPEASRCYLPPDTPHKARICDTGTALCREISFRTSAVVTDFQPPAQDATDMPSSSQVIARGREVIGAHPAGTAFLRYRPTTGGSWSTTPGDAVAKSDSDAPVALATRTMYTDFPWQRYEVESCFTYTSPFTKTMCTPTSQFTAGYITAPDDATAVTSTTATVRGLPLSPWPAATLLVRARTGADSSGDPAGAEYATIGSKAINAYLTTSTGTPTSIDLTGLAASTTYHWAVCFDNAATSGIEDCSAVRSFVTAAAPQNDGGNGTGGNGSGGGGDTTPVAIKPRNTVRPRIVGVKRVGKTLTCTRGTWTPAQGVTFSYRWKRGPRFIPRATTRARLLVGADQGTRLTCVVTAKIGAKMTLAMSLATSAILRRA